MKWPVWSQPIKHYDEMFWPLLYVMENLAGLLGNMSEGLMNLPDGPCLWSNLLFNFSVVFPSCCNLICIRAVHSSLCSPFSTCVPTHGQLFSNSVFFLFFLISPKIWPYIPNSYVYCVYWLCLKAWTYLFKKAFKLFLA